MTLTWTATFSGLYIAPNIVSETADITLINPCTDPNFAMITGADLTPRTYIIEQGDKTFDRPTFSVVPAAYATLCGDLEYTVQYGDPLVNINGISDPVSFLGETFTINSVDQALIGQVVDYRVVAEFADYKTVPGVSKYDQISTITYESPCPLVTENGISYTTFQAKDPVVFADDDYTGTVFSQNIKDLFEVTPEFCLGQVTYNCLTVEGPSGFGGTKLYEGIDYPVQLCSSIDSDFVATFFAGAINYRVLLDQFKMPPGEYTFTYEARSPDVSQITEVAITNTITWTLIDPCVNQQITLSAFTDVFTYTLNDVAITDISLPEVVAVPGLT